MKFNDFVSVKSIRAQLAAPDKEGVIQELVSALVEAEQVNNEEQESIIKAIMKREELGSTGIAGRNVFPSVRRSHMRLAGHGRCRSGRQWRRQNVARVRRTNAGWRQGAVVLSLDFST